MTVPATIALEFAHEFDQVAACLLGLDLRKSATVLHLYEDEHRYCQMEQRACRTDGHAELRTRAIPEEAPRHGGRAEEQAESWNEGAPGHEEERPSPFGIRWRSRHHR